MFVLSDNTDTLIGMRLCGIDGRLVHDEAEMSSALDELLEKPDLYGTVLIAEKLSSMCSEKVLDIKLNRRTPLIVVIPDRHGAGRSENAIMSYVRDSIGIKL